MTGGRVKRAERFIADDTFLLTYGDGVADVNIARLIEFHRSHGGRMTMTSVQPEGRFGALQTAPDGRVEKFTEKPRGDGSWINGGFFVCEPQVLEYIRGDDEVLEKYPLETLAKEGELYTYRHDGFWKCMDTLRDRQQLQEMWEKGEARWKVW
jgi:glucose-1-phosphate cytidylyltransferase